MENSLVVALAITAIGMTLLFLALALFYGLLSLMMSVFEVRSRPKSLEEEKRTSTEGGVLSRAAVIAVALARAEGEQGILSTPAFVTGRGMSREPVSPWWSLHHQREVMREQRVRRLP